jgi:transcriptional regulator with XRE-family HTH domain
MTASTATIGQLIKTKREAHGWTQKELAEKADVSPATVSGAENERFIPSPEILHRLAMTLQLPLPDLIDRLPALKFDTLLEIVQIYRHLLEIDRAFDLIARAKAEPHLMDYQRDALQFEEGSMLIIKPDTRMQGVEMLSALVTQVEAAPRPDPLFVIKIHNSLGSAWYMSRDFYTAKHHYQRAIELLHSHPTVEDKVVPALYYNIASCLVTVRQERLAVDYLNRAIPLMKTYRLPYFEGSCYYMLGVCYSALGEPDNSAAYYRKAVPFYEAAGDLRYAVRSRSYSYFYGPDAPQETIPVLEEELVLLADLLDDDEKAATHARIAKLHLDLGDLHAACAQLDCAKRLITSTEPKEERGIYLLTAARYLLAAGEYEAASSYANEASEVYASLRYYNVDLQEALNLSRIALQRLRDSFGLAP